MKRKPQLAVSHRAPIRTLWFEKQNLIIELHGGSQHIYQFPHRKTPARLPKPASK
jgi:hypothetical protein